MDMKAKRSEYHEDTPEFRERLHAAVRKYGAELTGVGHNSVGVQGDARVVGPVAIVSFPPELTIEEASRIATKLINEVTGLTRVLMEIRTDEATN